MCYALLLIKIFFLSRVSILELFNSQRAINRSFNLIPFHSISEYISGNTANLKRFASANVVGNILVFIPLGVYLSLFKSKSRSMMNLLFLFMVSLFIEIIQGLLGIGAADIDDIILNALGGWIGILVYKSLLFILRDVKRVQTAIAGLSVLIGLPVIYYYLFMIKMRF
ncbi:VanZ family protein [Cohnella caldifontis]|uniref:VanZ family protein n=1 Tax=Cohnella caldifontis TaxID=3027471 RepID=UPI0023EB5E7B|nr:VanZ family protein [Cohnella sp. YIM B05605]